ncbi:SUKH-3 domain-containing protein [Micromonospora mangrovi]|uniref:SUKH-3 domain-containing protein n=2 Tax=Micromonospora TaxID=1873 RepID=A0AAU8HCA1_9ACTN
MRGTSDLADQTRQALEAAGWRPGRTIEIAGGEAELVADGFPPLHPVARRFLAEYGGLRLPYSGPGVTRAREAIELMPDACSGEADRFIEWSEHVQRRKKSTEPASRLVTACSRSGGGAEVGVGATPGGSGRRRRSAAPPPGGR